MQPPLSVCVLFVGDPCIETFTSIESIGCMILCHAWFTQSVLVQDIISHITIPWEVLTKQVVSCHINVPLFHVRHIESTFKHTNLKVRLALWMFYSTPFAPNTWLIKLLNYCFVMTIKMILIKRTVADL